MNIEHPTLNFEHEMKNKRQKPPQSPFAKGGRIPSDIN
jgi:hypothetical protein